MQPSKGRTCTNLSHVLCPFCPQRAEDNLPGVVFHMFLCSNTPDVDSMRLKLADKELLIGIRCGGAEEARQTCKAVSAVTGKVKRVEKKEIQEI